MSHSFDERFRKELKERAQAVNPTMQNYVALMRKVGKLQYQVKINRIMIGGMFALILVILLINNLDPNLHI